MNVFNQLIHLIPTNHAELRMAQRNISRFELEFVLDHGHKQSRNDAVIYVLRSCDIPDCLWHEFSYLVGTTVIFPVDSRCIITVYKDHQWQRARRIRREPKIRRSRMAHWKYH